MTHYFDESFVVAICFVAFIYLAYQPVRKAILASLDARIQEIKDKLEETETIRNDAKKLLDDLEHKMSDFEARKQVILDSAEVTTKRLVETKTQEMELLLARKKESAVKFIENQKTKATAAMRDEFTESVLNMVRTYLVETKNNSVSDEEIINHFIKK
ncbi:MAG: hypothetical protein COA94_06380 [Rickettsiales bacterium]|nr:MAG: hypothetical protein COA94_06380 [Rickettsiales bacterium]